MIEPDQEAEPQTAPPIVSKAAATTGGRKSRQTILEPIDESIEDGPIEVAPTRQEPVVAHITKTVRFRPSVRPPMARLLVLDDTGKEAEKLRIRDATFRIGRETGDLVISHDAQMSGEHAEISRKLQDDHWRWVVSDLKSTNGTFFRVSENHLNDGQELIIGGRVYRFECQHADEAPKPAIVNRRQTMAVGGAEDRGPKGSAKLVEVNPVGTGRSIPLSGAEQWIGRDPQLCSIVLDDPMVSAQDAKIRRDADNEWFVKGGKSVNGLWVRVESVVIQGKGAQFQCGEQRFLLWLDR